jgi:hypothetical protein
MPPLLSLRRYAAAALLLLLPACGSPSEVPPTEPPPPPENPQAEWLKANAHPIRSLSIADRDFSDLQGDWTRVLDGMIYTRDMTPSTAATR